MKLHKVCINQEILSSLFHKVYNIICVGKIESSRHLQDLDSIYKLMIPAVKLELDTAGKNASQPFASGMECMIIDTCSALCLIYPNSNLQIY